MLKKKMNRFVDLIRYQLAAVASSIAVIAVCTSILAARYIWHVEAVAISGWLGPVGMATNTATCLILLALGQILHIFGSIKRRNQSDVT